MSHPRPTEPHQLSSAIADAWAELQAFLSEVTNTEASRQDPSGWTLKDHLTHIAVWEDSVGILFRGGLRHQALGIEEAFYTRASFDEINEAIKTRLQDIPLSRAIEMMSDAHNGLMVSVRPLTEGELQTSVSDFFPRAPRGDDRTMATFIFDNTADHYLEHLRWMKDLVGGSA